MRNLQEQNKKSILLPKIVLAFHCSTRGCKDSILVQTHKCSILIMGLHIFEIKLTKSVGGAWTDLICATSWFYKSKTEKVTGGGKSAILPN